MTKILNRSQVQSLEAHPFAALFPMAGFDEIKGISGDIENNGFRSDRPIIVFEGQILDGRNRRSAVLNLRECDVPVVEFDGDHVAAFKFVVSENLHRRHMSTAQKAVAAANIAQWDLGMNQHDPKAANLPTQKQVAETLSISERAIRSAKRICEQGNEQLLTAINGGKLSIHSAEALIGLGDRELSNVLIGERKQIVARAKEIREENQKASLGASIGTKTASAEDRGLNFYETPIEALWALYGIEAINGDVWEPACGKGAISKWLEAQGHDVMISDIEDRGLISQHGEPTEMVDFTQTKAGDRPSLIITNPPYGEGILNHFIVHALREHRPQKMALLLNLNFMAGFEDADRCWIWDHAPPARVHVHSRRLPMMHRDGWEGKKASSSMNTAWFIWDRVKPNFLPSLNKAQCKEMAKEFPYGTQTELHRVDWKEFLPSSELTPDAKTKKGE